MERRTPRGEEHANAKLNEKAVREMRRLNRVERLGCRRLARLFGISVPQAARVLNGSAWAHVE